MSVSAIILLGAPGAGKGTIAEGLAAATGYVHLSTGDMLRAAIKAGAALGRAAESLMQKGNLVPDDLIVAMVGERVRRGPADCGYLFDGFPRTLGQAEMLDAFFAKIGAAVAFVFLLEVPQAVVLDRLTGRRVCRQCGAIFHVRNIPPRREGVCDACGGELIQRPDDTRDTILNRIEVYQKQTADLIAYYEHRGSLKRIDSSRHREVTVNEIRGIMARAQPGKSAGGAGQA